MPLLALTAALLATLLASPASANQLLLGFNVGGAVSECATAPCYNGTPFVAVYDWVTDDNSTDVAVSGGTDYDLTLANGAAVNTTCPASFGGKCLDVTDTANDDNAQTSTGVYTEHGTMVSGDAYTFCTWFYPDSEDVDNQLIWEQAGGQNNGWELRYEKTNDKCKFRARVGSTWKESIAGNNSCTNSSWTHICGVIYRDGSGVRTAIYIDGAKITNTSATSNTYQSPGIHEASFGDSQGSKTKPGYFGEGTVTLAVYPTDDEICILANCGPFNEFGCTCSGSDYASSTGKALSCMTGIASGLCAKREMGTQ